MAVCALLGPLAPSAQAIGCDEGELIQAMVDANDDPALTTIDLAEGCVYSYTAPYATPGPYTSWYGPSALPAVGSTVTIEGNGATIERSSETPFRLLFVGADPSDSDTSQYASPGPGELTLRNLTLRGGLARGGSSFTGGGGAGMGGAIFSQGQVTLERVTLTQNTAQGGMISNAFGTGGGGIGQDAGLSGTSISGGFGSGFAGGVGGLGAAGANSDGGGGGGFRSGDNGIGSAGGGPETGLGNTGGFITGFGPGGNGSGGGGGGGGPATAGNGGSFGNGGTSGGLGLSGGAGGGGVGGGGGAGTGGGGSGGFGGGGGQGVAGGNGGFGGGGAAGSLGAGTGGFGAGNGLNVRGGGGAGMGGAIFNHQGELNATNSTLSGNSANGGTGTGVNPGQGLGGAVFNLNGAVNLDSVTIASNTVTPNQGLAGPEGGALYDMGYMGADTGAPGHNYTAQATLVNSILADSNGVPEVVANAPANVAGGAPGTVAGGGPNTVDDPGDTDVNASAPNLVESYVPSGSGTITGTPSVVDPQLEPLAPNDGLTQTHAITALSPAFNTGDTPLAVDQRGIARPQGEGDDIGAFELAVAAPADLAITKTASAGAVAVGQDVTYTLAVKNNGPAEASGVTATDVLPAGVAFKSAGSAEATCGNLAGVVTCDFGSVASGATESAQIVVTAQVAGALSNTATVAGGGQDPVAGNNSSTVVVTAGGGGANLAPVIESASLSRRKFRLGRRAPAVASKRRPPVGTVIRVRLSEAATVRLSFERLLRRGRTRKVRRTVKLDCARGPNKIRFQGRLTRRAKLRPGRYRMTIVATDSSGQRSASKRLKFRLLAAR